MLSAGQPTGAADPLAAVKAELSAGVALLAPRWRYQGGVQQAAGGVGWAPPQGWGRLKLALGGERCQVSILAPPPGRGVCPLLGQSLNCMSLVCAHPRAHHAHLCSRRRMQNAQCSPHLGVQTPSVTDTELHVFGLRRRVPNT